MTTIKLRPDLVFYRTQVTLDGVLVTLQFRWNTRNDSWFMEIYDGPGVTLLIGAVRIVVDFPLATSLVGRTPPGLFVAVDTSGQGLDPGRHDLGDRVHLTYSSVADLKAALTPAQLAATGIG